MVNLDPINLLADNLILKDFIEFAKITASPPGAHEKISSNPSKVGPSECLMRGEARSRLKAGWTSRRTLGWCRRRYERFLSLRQLVGDGASAAAQNH
jgi:hypothetical protein